MGDSNGQGEQLSNAFCPRVRSQEGSHQFWVRADPRSDSYNMVADDTTF